MQYSPLQTDRTAYRNGEVSGTRFSCAQILIYLSSLHKYDKMYKSPHKIRKRAWEIK